MYTEADLLIAATATLLVGALAGALLAAFFAPDNRKSRDLERRLNDTTDDLKAYRQEVSEHYAQTAQLIDDLTESYRKVHNHLAEGAATLLDTRGGRPIMRNIPSQEQIEAVGDPDSDEVLPPLDYAPKHSPYEKGMLDESFGLDKQASNSDQDDEELQKQFYRQE